MFRKPMLSKRMIISCRSALFVWCDSVVCHVMLLSVMVCVVFAVCRFSGWIRVSLVEFFPRCRQVSDTHLTTRFSVNLFQHALKIHNFSSKIFCRVCLRKILEKWLKTAYWRCKKRPFLDSDASSPPPSSLKSSFLTYFSSFSKPVLKFSKPIFASNWPLRGVKLTTLRGQTDHF